MSAAVHGEYAAPPASGSLYSEADWNETSTAEGGQAYHLSKARVCSEDLGLYRFRVIAASCRLRNVESSSAQRKP